MRKQFSMTKGKQCLKNKEKIMSKEDTEKKDPITKRENVYRTPQSLHKLQT
jgi:hypothetical protein